MQERQKDLLSFWRLDPSTEVGYKAGFAVFDRLLVFRRFSECFLQVSCSDKVEQFRPQWLTSQEL